MGGQTRTKGQYQYKHPQGAVIHYTAGRSKLGEKDAKQTLLGGIGAGYCFFVISAAGQVYQDFPLDRWGIHCGKSAWLGLGSDLDNRLVGIEICNAGSGYKSWFKETYSEEEVRHVESEANIKAGVYHKYTESQEKALVRLLLWLKGNAPNIFSFDYVLGHDEIAPNRKLDPGGSLSMTMPNFRLKLKSLYEPI
jgi:N-acetyl-anhydromuramyl-L-alanine amidase AmpD